MTERLMIDEALNRWKQINSNPHKWATFESVRFPKDSRCVVKWGFIHSDGTKELPIQTILWTLYDNGRYDGATTLNHV